MCRVKLHLSAAALAAALLVASPVTFASRCYGDDKADKAAKEKKEKELAKAKEELEKKLRTKKIDPAPAVSFLATLVETADIEVSKAKDLLDKVMTKKIPFDEALKGADKVIAESPKDPKKVVKDLGEWINKWKPAEPKKEEPAKKPEEPKKGTDKK
jgi:hypothetical protein